MLYAQTTEEEKYANAVAQLAPATIAVNINRYEVQRAVVLGLPMQDQNGPVQQASLKLSDRLKVLGTNLAAMLEASKDHKDFIKAQVAKAVAELGGLDKILPTSEWSFLLPYVEVDDKGVKTFALPSLPFEITV